ncbi:c-type cytochrome [Gayadomonas joobiniege]|uniref:c-type cytochrome n=1 Tax=Gayadomonas joobiniege TaxID=1234606 RepID=UPI0003683020|nr:c-type cytochrome [Gayadomonas joobiniege]
MLKVIVFILTFFIPPVGLVARKNVKFTYQLLSVLIWSCAALCFFYYSVLIALLVHTGLVIFSVFYPLLLKRQEIFSTQKRTSRFLFLSVTIICVLSVYEFSSRTAGEDTVVVKSKKNQKLNLNSSLENGADLFKNCLVCHGAEPGKHLVGPTLFKVFGRKSGILEGYNYSESMKTIDIVWDEQNLTKFLNNQNAVVPGTRMFISPMSKNDIQDLILYLKKEQAD